MGQPRHDPAGGTFSSDRRHSRAAQVIDQCVFRAAGGASGGETHDLRAHAGVEGGKACELHCVGILREEGTVFVSAPPHLAFQTLRASPARCDQRPFVAEL